jgi:hypothetical protein
MGRALVGIARVRSVNAGLVLISALIACSPRGVHLEIFGDADSIGAEVVLDSKLLGKMEPVAGIRPDQSGAHLSLHLPNGNHALQFRKEGRATVHMKVNVPNEREHYLYVEMANEDRRARSPSSDSPR